MMIAITEEKIGRSMKNFENTSPEGYFDAAWAASSG
jgi:hypothetical protein